VLLFALRLCYIPWMTLQYSSVCVWNSVKYYMWSTPFGFPYMPCPAFTSPAVWCRVFQSRVFWPCIFDCPASSSLAFSSPPFKEEEINSSKCLRQADWCKRLMTPGSDSGHIRRMENAHFHSRIFSHDTIRYDTRCYFNVRSKADISRLNPPHGNDN